MQHCATVNQYNTTLSGCDFSHMGGATLVWHGLWLSSLLGPKTLTPLLKFDKYSPECPARKVDIQASHHFTLYRVYNVIIVCSPKHINLLSRMVLLTC